MASNGVIMMPSPIKSFNFDLLWLMGCLVLIKPGRIFVFSLLLLGREHKFHFKNIRATGEKRQIEKSMPFQWSFKLFFLPHNSTKTAINKVLNKTEYSNTQQWRSRKKQDLHLNSNIHDICIILFVWFIASIRFSISLSARLYVASF